MLHFVRFDCSVILIFLMQLPGLDFADPQDPSMFPIARLISQGPVPQDKPSPLYPGMFYMSYGANQLNSPARLGILSSEEMAGGRGGPLAYGAMFPGFGGMRPNLGGMPPTQPRVGTLLWSLTPQLLEPKAPRREKEVQKALQWRRPTQLILKAQLSFQR